MDCPNHTYFRLADGKLTCDACGQPPVPTETPAAKGQAGKRKKS